MKPFVYSICDAPDEDIFKRQCEAIEKHIPGLHKEPILTDVDGSSIQTYKHKNGSITVHNSYYTNDLYVDADFDLLPYFK